MKGKNYIEVFSSQNFKALLRLVERAASETLSYFCVKNAVLRVFLLTDSEISVIHSEQKKKKSPATVLSFRDNGDIPHPELGRGKRMLGEIYIAPSYISRRGGELLFFLTHGILHILGYTHKRNRDRIEMERKEKELLSILRKKGIYL